MADTLKQDMVAFGKFCLALLTAPPMFLVLYTAALVLPHRKKNALCDKMYDYLDWLTKDIPDESDRIDL